jgi:hypothetical protein
MTVPSAADEVTPFQVGVPQSAVDRARQAQPRTTAILEHLL